ncbi:MAG: hypothetical protein K0S56_1807 [Microvirga sp.]|nr:hypothetical protein [Microvirga sp.]
MLAKWLETRAWREIDYVFLLNEQIRRYGMGSKRKHITLLAKQSFQEAEHYEDVGRAVESNGWCPSDQRSLGGGAVEQLAVGAHGPPSSRGDRGLVRL